MSETSHPEIGDYIILQTIGSGSYGKVKLGISKKTGQNVAIKIVKKSIFETNQEMAIKIRREISLMRLFNHPHLLKLLDVLESSRHLYIVLEYAAHRELFDFLQDETEMNIEVSIRLFRQIIYGLEFLHTHSICHRDLKPENILLDENDNVKIADFGFARWMKDNTAITACGSPHYAAPEIIIGKPYDGRPADIWSCGVIFYTMMCGRLPFDEPTVRKLLSRVKRGKFIMPELPNDIKDLIQRMLTVDPKKRITIAQIKQHPTFRIGLLPYYICPTPQPIPEKLPKYELKKLSEIEIDVLHQLGFSDEELEKDLQSDTRTSAQELCFMMQDSIAFDSINWEIHESVQSPAVFDVSKQFQFDGDLVTQFQEVKGASVASFSVAERSIFCLNQDDGRVEREKKSIETSCPYEILMNALQSFLNDINFMWTYPDDFMLLARSKSNDKLDVIIEDVQKGENIHSVDITMMSSDSPDIFETFINRITKVITSLVY